MRTRIERVALSALFRWHLDVSFKKENLHKLYLHSRKEMTTNYDDDEGYDFIKDEYRLGKIIFLVTNPARYKLWRCIKDNLYDGYKGKYLNTISNVSIITKN